MTAGAAPEPGLVPIRRALLSVGDHRGLYDLACALDARGVTLVSTHSVWIALGNQGLMTTVLGGDHELVELAAIGVDPFDLVIGNPRRFAIPAERPDGTLAMAMAEVDDGGVTLLQAAAKNWTRVAVIVDPDDYPAVLDELDAHDRALTAVTRLRLASKAFVATAAHDAAVASYLADLADHQAHTPDAVVVRPRLGALVTGPWRRIALELDDRDRSALYLDPPAPLGIVDDDRVTVLGARRVGGRALLASTVRDLDRALALVRDLDGPAAVIVRDDQPVAASESCDPYSALRRGLTFADYPHDFGGGSLALDQPLTPEVAGLIKRSGLTAVVVPAVPADELARWPDDGPCLLVAPGGWHDQPAASLGLALLAWRSIGGGLLVQEVDVAPIGRASTISARPPTADEQRDLELAARVARHVRGHALVMTARGSTAVIVGDQPDLRTALVVARTRVGDILTCCVAATSARIDDPADLDALAEAGIVALYQPAGSPRDQDIMAAADRHAMAMVVTGLEHLRR